MAVDAAGVAAPVIGARVLETALSNGAAAPPADASGWATVPVPVAGAAESGPGIDASVAAPITEPVAGAGVLVCVDAAGVTAAVTGARAFAAADIAGVVGATGAAELESAALGPVEAALAPVELALVDEFAAEVPVLVAGARALVAVDTTEFTVPALGAAGVAAADVEGFGPVEVAADAAWDPASALDAVADGAAGAGG